MAFIRKPQVKETRRDLYSIRHGLEWPKEGLLFESDLNECSGRIIEVMLGALDKIWHPPEDRL